MKVLFSCDGVDGLEESVVEKRGETEDDEGNEIFISLKKKKNRYGGTWVVGG